MNKLPIFKLEDYFSAHEFSTKYMLGSSDIDAFTMNEVVQMADDECKQIWNNLSLSYTETFGHPLLRKEISKLYSDQINKKNIACFAGAEEGIYAICHSILKKNDHAIIVTPCYQSLESIPASICDITAVPITYENKWQLDVEKVKSAIQANTKLIIINFPHNPTGASLTADQQQELINIAQEKNIWIFSDEVYQFAELDPKDKVPAIASIYEKGLSLGVMSKAFALPGLRIGWVACQDEDMLKKIEQFKHYLSICNSAPSEILALIALRNKDSILKRNNKIVTDNLKLLDQFFIDNKEILEWVRPTAGCTGFAKILINISASDFCDQLRKSKGVLLLPSTLYNHKNRYFRIGFGRKNMPEALQKLQEFINETN